MRHLNENSRVAEIVEASRDFSPRERLKIKDEKSHFALKVLTKEKSEIQELEIDVAGYALVKVHNPRAKNNTDYEILVIEDKEGATYATSSNSFKEAFFEIWDEMEEHIEELKIKAYSLPSKNNENGFLTCSIV